MHRIDKSTNGHAKPHMVSTDELEKVIKFLKMLVTATDSFVRLAQHESWLLAIVTCNANLGFALVAMHPA